LGENFSTISCPNPPSRCCPAGRYGCYAESLYSPCPTTERSCSRDSAPKQDPPSHAVM
jgi:hypothetical protein